MHTETVNTNISLREYLARILYQALTKCSIFASDCAIVQEGIYDEFTKIVAKKVENFHLGDGAQEGVNLGPLINPPAVDRV